MVRPSHLRAVSALLWFGLSAAGCSSSSTESPAGPTPARCSLTLSGTPPVVESTGASGSLTLAINRECAWTAKPEVGWISVSPASGQGGAQINYNIASNPQPVERRGTIVVNERRVELMQRPACVFTLTPAHIEASASRQRLTVTLSGPAGCTWSAVSRVGWIEVESGASGSGPGTVTLEVTANRAAAGRTGDVVIAGLTFTVRQKRGNTPAPAPPEPAPPTAPAPEPTPPPVPPPPPDPEPTPTPGPNLPPVPKPPPGPDPTPIPGPSLPPVPKPPS